MYQLTLQMTDTQLEHTLRQIAQRVSSIVEQALDDCLLSEEEVLRGKAYWKTLNDPFPTWEQNA